MTEEETILDGVTYISSKRASELTDYSQDYIGQLARSGQIEARRVGGLWFVNLVSLTSHKAEPNSPKAVLPSTSKSTNDPDTFVAFDGKSYISASRASKLSGYNQDYIGQLSRSGQILSRLVGNRWYVDQKSLLDHKTAKDALLAAVQRDAVGIDIPERPMQEKVLSSMEYFPEEVDLLPKLAEKSHEAVSRNPISSDPLVHHARASDDMAQENSIPIRKAMHSLSRHALILKKPAHKPSSQSSLPTIFALSASALTIVIVVSLGYSSIKSQSIYATSPVRTAELPAAAGGPLDGILSAIENLLVPELVYRRTD